MNLLCFMTRALVAGLVGWSGMPAPAVRVTSVSPFPGQAVAPGLPAVVLEFDSDVSSQALNFRSVHLTRVNTSGSESDIGWNVGPVWETPRKARLPLPAVAQTTGSYRLRIKSDRADLSKRDADLLAAVTSGTVTPPAELRDRIEADLNVIRQADPRMTAITFRPAWVPDQVVVGLTSEAAASYNAGTYNAWDQLNSQYGLVSIRHFLSGGGLSFYQLRFAGNYNSEALARFYAQLPGVVSSKANSVIGDGGNITTETLGANWSYIFRHGWDGCSAGCISSHYWKYTVQNGVPTLLAEWGNEMPPEETLKPAIVLGSDGEDLDGELNGTLPSGNGTAGGDFVMAFEVRAPTAAEDWNLFY